MKFMIFLTMWSCIFACRPEGSNKPKCNSSNLNIQIRNFWIPEYYWLCTAVDAEPLSIRCPESQAFDEDRKCIPYSEWKWTKPCSQSKSSTEIENRFGERVCVDTCNEACKKIRAKIDIYMLKNRIKTLSIAAS